MGEEPPACQPTAPFSHAWRYPWLQDHITRIIAYIGAGTGIAGVILGLLSLWKDIVRNMTRLRITATNEEAIIDGSGHVRNIKEVQFANSPQFARTKRPLLEIEVVNIGTQPVTVKSVGLGYKKWWRIHQLEAIPFTDGSQQEHRLESGASLKLQSEKWTPETMPTEQLQSVIVITAGKGTFTSPLPTRK